MNSIFLIIFLIAGEAQAALRVVTTLPSFADIVERIGGDEVDVTTLTKAGQDPHFVDAKPAYVLTLNRADLLVRAGLGLEDGWLPPLLTGARNRKIQSGAAGNFDASTVVELRDIPKGRVDRSQGDVHPGGNPHYMTDPRNGIRFAKAVSEQLGKLAPEKRNEFQQKAAEFEKELTDKIGIWEKNLRGLKGTPIVTYHKSWSYLTAWLGLKEVGTVEPKPGIPPSPLHTAELVREMKKNMVKFVLIEPYYPVGVAEEVAKAGNAKLLVLPLEPELAGGRGYITLFERITEGLEGK